MKKIKYYLYNIYKSLLLIPIENISFIIYYLN